MNKCEANDLPEILAFYQFVIRETDDMPRYGRWVYGLHPTEEMIEDYHDIPWQVELRDDEVAVVHLLAVNLLPLDDLRTLFEDCDLDMPLKDRARRMEKRLRERSNAELKLRKKRGEIRSTVIVKK